ncbi:MAG: ribosome silencing factor [Flavobacteriales bacterium AspAUS03]
MGQGSVALLGKIIEGIQEVKGEAITVLDLKNKEYAVCDYFVICNGNSHSQVSAISCSVKKITSKQLKERPWHVEGLKNAQWVLIDYVSVVVHIFQKELREYYDLESLLGDVKRINMS